MNCLSEGAGFHAVLQHASWKQPNHFITGFMSNAVLGELTQLIYNTNLMVLALYLFCWARFQHDVLCSQWSTRCCSVLAELPGRLQCTSPLFAGRCMPLSFPIVVPPAKKRAAALNLLTAAVENISLTLWAAHKKKKRQNCLIAWITWKLLSVRVTVLYVWHPPVSSVPVSGRNYRWRRAKGGRSCAPSPSTSSPSPAWCGRSTFSSTEQRMKSDPVSFDSRCTHTNITVHPSIKRHHLR